MVWGPRISWQANYRQPLRFGEDPRRELSISCGHPGTRHQRLQESDHTCDDADDDAGTLALRLEHEPSGEYPAC